MTTQHPNYPQLGHSSPLVFEGNSPYQRPHQHPASSTPPSHPARSANGVGRPPYSHNAPGHPVFPLSFSFHQPFQPGLPEPHHHHSFPHPSYQQQSHSNGISSTSHSFPNMVFGHGQGQFTHEPPQCPSQISFSPSFQSRNQPYPQALPLRSLSALPKQLHMPQPGFPPQSSTFPTHHIPPYAAIYHNSNGSRADSSGLVSSDYFISPPQTILEPHEFFPDRKNPIKGLALQTKRPNVSDAVAFTVSSAARPPQFYYNSILEFEGLDTYSSLHYPRANPQPTLPPGVAGDLLEITREPDSHSLTSPVTATTTPATSTAPHTPTPGSPHSSMTSLSFLDKSPSGVVLEVSASPSVTMMDIDTPTLGVEVTQPPISQQQHFPFFRDPIPPPAKKTWASLLRPAPIAASGFNGTTQPNSLPTSSVQGFSISASLPTASSVLPPSQWSPGLISLLTAPNALAGHLAPIRSRGIVNLGNMCFANTVLQVLVHCPPFHKLFTELDKHVLCPTAREVSQANGMAIPLVNATINFMKEFQVLPQSHLSPKDYHEDDDTARDALVPSYVYDALKEKKRFDSMRGGQQEDAEEFLGFYLETLEEELLSIITRFSSHGSSTLEHVIPAMDEQVENDKPTDGWLEVGKKNKTVITRTHKTLDSPISRIFGGKFRTSLRVPGARETAMVDPWSRLQLDIQPDYIRTIEDALRNIATPGTVQVTSSSRSALQVDASQQTLIEILPPVLILHLKRFLYDTTVNDVIKLSKKVAFGTELEIPKETITPGRRSWPTKYKLFGVLNHHGSSATGGHYTLDALHPDPHDRGREGWVRIDDELVQNIRAEDLTVRNVGDDRSAYLLFYRRVHPPGSDIRM
ncbi:cysteine proteinase [Ramaria rubella]|nr:cysteine proteinase [Ramaria rubella]